MSLEKGNAGEPTEQAIEILVENSPGTLAEALKVFNDEVNLITLHDYRIQS